MLHVTPESLHERLPTNLRIAPHLIITADARIDNRDELFDALGVPEPGRDRTPDSSLILLAYERWGEACVQRFLGDFAFAIWDNRERKLFCARDHFGCRPFVYHFDGKRFVFASDIKGVLAQVESPRLHEGMIATYLQYRTGHAEKKQTFFEGIVKIPASHTLSVTSGENRLTCYWSMKDSPEIRFRNDDEYAQCLASLFRESVASRVRSQFPVGVHISGGLDSSSVAIAAARALRAQSKSLHGFSWSERPQDDDPPDSGGGRISAVCEQESITCQHVPPTIAALVESFQLDFTTEPIVMMEREADVQTRANGMNVRTVLSGWGGDDAVTAHTNTYLTEFFLRGQWRELKRATDFHLAKAGPGISLLKAKHVYGIARTLIVPQFPDSLYAKLHPSAPQNLKQPCIQTEFAKYHEMTVHELRPTTWRLHSTVRATVRCHLGTGAIERRMEHWATSGARKNLEYRFPMLDKRLIEFMLGIPAAQFSGPITTRSIFRRAFGHALPPSCNWGLAKIEPPMSDPRRKSVLEAYMGWVEKLRSEKSNAAANRLVDIEKLRRAIERTEIPGRLTGVREAFQCFAIQHLM